jgi:heme exporter protein B
MKNTWVLVRRYFSQEVRNSNVLFSLGLYLVGVAYLIYLLNGGGVPADKTWNSLLWIVVFFGAIQLSARSFEYESNDYFYYYQTIAGPAATIIAKLLFNSAYIAVISGLTWGLFSLFFGNPVFNTLLFGLALLLGSVGCSVVLTLTSGVAQRTQGNATLSAILALPLLLPILQLTSVLNLQAIVGVPTGEALNLVASLAALDIGIGLLAYLLFPYLWQD